jgi:hypothetical protein
MIDGQDIAIPNACVELVGLPATAPCAAGRIVTHDVAPARVKGTA